METTVRPMRIVEMNAEKTVMEVANQTGKAKLTKYNVYPGMDIVYLDAHIQHFSCYARPHPNVFAINHCEEGRVECQFRNGEFLYMGPNDMSVGWRSNEDFCHTTYFPRSHYHGLSIIFDVQQAQPMVDKILGNTSLNITQLCSGFCHESDFGMIMKENQILRNLFRELYHVPHTIQQSYRRLKIVETLLLLSTIDYKKQKKIVCFPKKQVEMVKCIRNELIQHLQETITIEEISAQYAISQTLLKRIFKAIYGTTIRQYIQEYRVEEAKRLLRDTNENIVEIAMRVGYSNSSKFSAAFKKHVDMLPKEYRRLHQRNSYNNKFQ